MLEFNKLFDKWAPNYDSTVYGSDNEYNEVFENYNGILEAIISKIEDKKNATVLEIGTGTGNLTKLLYENKFQVVGIEPSYEMRKIAKLKLPNVEILDGHFLSIPIRKKVDVIVTSYAFHHLTIKEKKKALVYLDSFLEEGGKIIIADTMFESEEYKTRLLEYVESTGAFNLLHDLNTEYYEYIDDISELFKELDYTLEINKMNKYVWIVSGTKGGF
ncbi:class I SAM-dependent methyltransferase [Tepidibacter formicigenes]|uniref:Uncharacterized methyltransferase SAMN02744037_00631 n=1 Tax=Tepidibacter formicigenes DSM 15518 TaxID=1123349 RepID=A0A1M6LDY2_9FIRM|nr:class I SAM-dependent methyltransferase [Tepidibacter formicigenes]SHJ69378.1 putative AdoMet-dependent methyltransferase [Tepidibacter formicigenes DSM 15518]